MIRSLRISRDHRMVLIAAALVPLALVACNDNPKSTQSASAGAGTPNVVSANYTPTPEAGVVSTGSSSPAVVSYSDAEGVFRAGRYDEAKRLFESYTAANPKNAFGYYMLGLSAWKAGDFAEADQALSRSIELDSTNIKSYLNSSRVLLDLARNHEALERAEHARELDETSADALRLIARAYHSMGQADSAVEAYHQALVIDPSDVWSMNNLGVLYLDLGQPESALSPLARAVQLRSTSPVFQNNLGIALERTGHIVAARSAFSSALRADSTYSKATVSLDRVNQLEIDTTDMVSVDDLAQEFRMQVGMWRDNLAKSAADTIIPPAPVTDSINHQ
jgi:Flp pilus assembly protein TadD